MLKEFREGCLSLSHPDNWTMEREDNDHGWTVTLYSPKPDTAFLFLILDNDFPDADQMVDTILLALREEYQNVEADEKVEQIAGQWAIGHDINFISLDLTNSSWTRSLDSPDGTVLVVCQATDSEMPRYEPVLQAIVASLHVKQAEKSEDE